eukprot:1004243-Rhodomonas_salina.2
MTGYSHMKARGVWCSRSRAWLACAAAGVHALTMTAAMETTQMDTPKSIPFTLVGADTHTKSRQK